MLVELRDFGGKGNKLLLRVRWGRPEATSGLVEAATDIVEDGVAEFLKRGQGVPRLHEFVAEENKVSTRFDCESSSLGCSVSLLNGAHIKVVRQDEVLVEPKSVTKQSLDDVPGQGGREIVVIDSRKVDMADHDGIQFRHESGIWNKVLAL